MHVGCYAHLAGFSFESYPHGSGDWEPELPGGTTSDEDEDEDDEGVSEDPLHLDLEREFMDIDELRINKAGEATQTFPTLLSTEAAWMDALDNFCQKVHAMRNTSVEAYHLHQDSCTILLSSGHLSLLEDEPTVVKLNVSQWVKDFRSAYEEPVKMPLYCWEQYKDFILNPDDDPTSSHGCWICRTKVPVMAWWKNDSEHKLVCGPCRSVHDMYRIDQDEFELVSLTENVFLSRFLEKYLEVLADAEDAARHVPQMTVTLGKSTMLKASQPGWVPHDVYKQFFYPESLLKKQDIVSVLVKVLR